MYKGVIVCLIETDSNYSAAAQPAASGKDARDAGQLLPLMTSAPAYS